ncbi:MAG TPA: response regulator [Nitrospiraceae bacterium]|jgi:DNA-binding NtrC family response regulator|nr:response regulator [Nitrospiraceae bacterium]
MKTILLVDDDRDILSYLQDALAAFGYDVIPQSDAEAALAIIREGAKIDLVVTDYRMPGMDGLEFFTALKRVLPSVPVIILTGHGSVETYLKSLSLGLYDYVSKPIEAKELDRIVKAALSRSETE